MHIARRLARNTISMLVAWGMQPLLSLVLAMVIGRKLGPELFGKYMVIFQLYYMFQIISSFGLRILLTREVATNKAEVNKYLNSGLLLSIPISLLNVVMIVSIGYMMKYDTETMLGINIISISLIASALADIFSGILAGVEKIHKIAYAWIIFLVLKTLFSIAILFFGYKIIELIIIHVITKFLHSLFTYYYIRKDVIKEFHLEIDFALCKKLVKMSWSLALVLICISFFWRIDTLMLSKMSTIEAVGNYGAAFKIFWFGLLGIQSFFTAFLPMISSLSINHMQNFDKACSKALRYLTILILPMVLACTFLSPQIMPFIWGDKFVSSALILQVMIWALIPFAVTEVFGSALVATNRQVTHLILYTITLAFKIGLNYFLILKFGEIGVAISTVLAVILLMFIQMPFIIPKLIKFELPGIIFPIVKVTVAFSIMAMFFYISSSLPLVVQFIIPAIFYIIFLYMLNIVTQDDKYYFRQMLKVNRQKAN